MITTDQAVQIATVWCRKYNIQIDLEEEIRAEVKAHTYLVYLTQLHGVLFTVVIDKETGGVINDIVF